MKSLSHNSGLRILVTGCRAPAAVDLIRWLGHAGHRVTASDSICLAPARFSRFAGGWLRYPPPRLATGAFAACVGAAASSHDLVWPCCEEVFWLAGIAGIPLFAPKRGLLLSLHHKGRLADRVNEMGHVVRAPKTLAPPPQAGQLPRGWIAKPSHGRFGHRNQRGPRPWPPADGRQGSWVFQEHIEGREICVHAIAEQGRVLAMTCYHDRGRMSRGPCVVFEKTDDSVVEDFVRAFCLRHDYTGQIGFDILVDSDGRRWVVDCNPRLTSGMHLIARKGCDVVELKLARLLSRPFRTRDASRPSAPDAVAATGDQLPGWILPLTACELLLRFPGSIASASTADLQWP